MNVFNTLTRQIEPVVPLEPGRVRMYTCGPTVYDFAHIGNFRAYVFEDVLRRVLRHRGFAVTQVMNLTDVDDKTIKGARARGVPLRDYTRTYIDAFFQDLDALNIERAEVYPAATEHIPEMIALIGTLMAKGVAYRSGDGSVYFSIERFPGYGRLARLDLSGLRPGARVSHDEYEKENAADFALWKAWDESDGDVAWDSPWGRGRPGWHIECSAMSMKYLGESFDIHTGGVDNIFPHHVDEIAQSEAATGKPFAKYWLHCAHLVVDGRKMSKSLGNFHTLRDVLKRGHTGREARYVLMSAQYRQSLNFTFEALDAARAALARIDEFRARLDEAARPRAEADGELPPWACEARDAFVAALENDLNVPEALSALFGAVSAGNRAMDGGPMPAGQALALLAMLRNWDEVLGVIFAAEARPPAAVAELAQRREAARRARDWAEADRLRKQIAEAGWSVKDTPVGPKLLRGG